MPVDVEAEEAKKSLENEENFKPKSLEMQPLTSQNRHDNEKTEAIEENNEKNGNDEICTAPLANLDSSEKL